MSICFVLPAIVSPIMYYRYNVEYVCTLLESIICQIHPIPVVHYKHLILPSHIHFSRIEYCSSYLFISFHKAVICQNPVDSRANKVLMQSLPHRRSSQSQWNFQLFRLNRHLQLLKDTWLLIYIKHEH
jgi:hypothetical protein